MRILAILAAVVALFIGGYTWVEDGKSNLPNIVLISVDTLRADRVGVYGHPQPITPHIDQLGTEGAVFFRAAAAMGITWPSHTTMLTGLYPRYHGVRSNVHKLGDDVVTIAEILHARGYATGSFVSFKAMQYMCGLGRGFEAVSDPGLSPGNATRDGRVTTDMTIQWLKKRDASKPFFLFTHFFEPHGPYDTTEYAEERLASLGYEGRFRNGADMEFLRKNQTPNGEDLSAMKTLYDGEVHLADQYVGEILAAIEEAGDLDNTVIIFTSDHGQALGDEGRMGHGPVLWDEILHVPLIIRDFRRDRPAQITDLVGLVDIAPTIAELTGTTLPSSQGQSLIAAIDGNPLPLREYYSEVTFLPDLDAPFYNPDRLAVYYDNVKFEVEGGELLAATRFAEPGTRVDDVELLKDDILALAEEYLAGDASVQRAELDEQTLEGLRTLGYIQ